ncbi:MAG: hypothetical protein DMG67_07245 [Acidobacteria bacterium]|nr:MAG: hypothetical protein DMG67_07245 [Acidobacteriota bacterium]
MSTAPTPSPAASGGLEPNIAGLLCYSPVGLICDIIWLVAEPYKNNKFIRFHAFQSLFLCGALFVLFIALWILGFILGMIAGPLALIIFPINIILFFGEIGLFIFMMIKAYGNNKTQLPIIGAMAAKQAGL